MCLYWDKWLNCLKIYENVKQTLHKKRSFPLRISLVNETGDLVTFTEKILNGKLHSSVQ